MHIAINPIYAAGPAETQLLLRIDAIEHISSEPFWGSNAHIRYVAEGKAHDVGTTESLRDLIGMLTGKKAVRRFVDVVMVDRPNSDSSAGDKPKPHTYYVNSRNIHAVAESQGYGNAILSMTFEWVPVMDTLQEIDAKLAIAGGVANTPDDTL